MKRFFLVLVLVAFFWPLSGHAHFMIDAQPRTIHVAPGEAGAQVILRFPLTLAYARELAARSRVTEQINGPFLSVELQSGTPFYRLDLAAIAGDPDGLGVFLLRDYRFLVEGVQITPQVRNFVLIDAHAAGRLETGLAATKELLTQYQGRTVSSYVGDTLVIVSLELPGVAAFEPLDIAIEPSQFAVPEGYLFETRFIDHRASPAQILTFDGLWPPAVSLVGDSALSLLTSARHFIAKGMHHIFFGFDHVLFVLCLVLAAPHIRGLLWSVTGFTLGHSITLAAGVLGWVPRGLWFIPFIELLVAGSILLVGLLVLLGKAGRQGFWLAGGLGLLHGFGFSFMLAEMLEGAGSGLVVALAGFNIGVELGQLIIVILAFGLLSIAAKMSLRLSRVLRTSVAVFASFVAVTMVVERSQILGEALSVRPTIASAGQKSGVADLALSNLIQNSDKGA